MPSEFNTTFTSQSVGPAPGTLQQSSSDFVRKWNAYAAEALKLGLPYDVFAKMVDEWSQTNQMDNLTAAESVLAGRRAEIAGASSVAARNIKDNPDALHTQQPGTVAVNAKSYDIGGMLNALLNAAAGGYTEVQRQRLQSKLVQAQIRGDKVHLPASTLPGGGFQTESRIPWGWILLGGAALVLTGVIVFKKRKGGAAASVASVAPAAPMAALPAPK